MVRKTLFLTTCVAVLTSGTLVADAAFRRWGQRINDFYAKYSCSRVPFPTEKQLRSALTYLQESPDSTLIDTRLAPKKLKLKLGNYIYLRDASSAMWFIEGQNLDEGNYGCVRRAWNLQESLEMGSIKKASQVPPAVAKIVVDINRSENRSPIPFSNEVDALRDLGRLVGSGYTILQSSQNHNDGFVYKEDGCRDPSLEEWGRRCPPGTQAIFLQKMIPGVPMDQNLQFWGEDRMRIIRRIFKKVQELHAAGWVHNDLHPGNVLVNEVRSQEFSNYDVELIDFGFATPREYDATKIEGDFEDVELFNISVDNGGYLPSVDDTGALDSHKRSVDVRRNFKKWLTTLHTRTAGIWMKRREFQDVDE